LLSPIGLGTSPALGLIIRMILSCSYSGHGSRTQAAGTAFAATASILAAAFTARMMRT
jgi:hypothetical protein